MKKVSKLWETIVPILLKNGIQSNNWVESAHVTGVVLGRIPASLGGLEIAEFISIIIRYFFKTNDL